MNGTGVIAKMSLCRVIVHFLGDRVHTVTWKGEPAFVIDNKMLEGINWSLNKVIQINEIMIMGQCTPHWKWKRLQVTRWE